MSFNKALLILLQMLEITSGTCEVAADTFIPNLVISKFCQIPIILYFICDTVFMIAR
jgi:hypothetical protein